MPRIIVLGAGRIGIVIAHDLARDDGFSVSIADRSKGALQTAQERCSGRVDTVQTDVSETQQLAQLIEPFDLVIGALSSSLGFQTLKAVIEAGKPYCDISFMPEDAWELDDLARHAAAGRGVTAIVDCGVAPGLSNLTVGYAVEQLDKATAVDIFVGGLPQQRMWPFDYRAGFSPDDVIEEYTRPARIVEQGRIVTKEALSDAELIDFPGVGTLEAFITDGLRSLIETIDVPNMTEKTMRYPGHCELMRIFRRTGLFSTTPIDIDGKPVRPLDLTRRLLAEQWRFQPGETDMTVMRVIVRGEKNGQPAELRWDLLDRYDHETHTTSMARTTAFPCAIAARAILDGTIGLSGVLTPERLAKIPGFFDRMTAQLRDRGVYYEQTKPETKSG